MANLPQKLYRIENDAVHQYDFFAITPNPNYAIYFSWGTTIPIQVNVHQSVRIQDGFLEDSLEAYKELRFQLQGKLDYIDSIIEELEHEKESRATG